MAIEMWSRLAELDPKDFKNKYLPIYYRDRVNYKRGVKKFVRTFTGCNYDVLIAMAGKLFRKTEQETVDVIKELGLIKENEDPKEIIDALSWLEYPGLYNRFSLEILENDAGEKIYQPILWGN